MKKTIFKKWWFWLIVIILISGAFGKNQEKQEPVQEKSKVDEIMKEEVKTEQPRDEEHKKEETTQEKIEKEIYLRESKYSTAKIDRVSINENLGTENIKDDYIVLVYMSLNPQSEKTGNEISEMFADDIAANLYEKGFKNIAEIAVFYEDKHNNRDLKYSYEYTDKGFKKVK